MRAGGVKDRGAQQIKKRFGEARSGGRGYYKKTAKEKKKSPWKKEGTMDTTGWLKGKIRQRCRRGGWGK